MSGKYINININNIDNEHICCAIADKKHQEGVRIKKQWIKDRLEEGHTFRKLDEKGKVFIEYAPLETAWVPVKGDNYMYIYCLWVSGSFRGKGHANELLNYCIEDAKKQGKSGICVLSSKKKKPYLSDKKFMLKYGFEVVDIIDDYELLVLSFSGRNETKPCFMDNVKKNCIDHNELTIYYGMQCPYIPNCIEQVKTYCEVNKIPVKLIAVDNLDKAKNIPCTFNNWAVFYNGKFETVHLLNEGGLKKLLLNHNLEN